MPRFSICISVFNGERYLRACIDSVLNQSFSDYELIIVDDASSDGSAAILEKYAENDKRITVVRKSQNEGLHLGHRTAIEKCSGDYILFLDADDEFEEGLLGKVDGALREDQQIDMLHFGIRVRWKRLRALISFRRYSGAAARIVRIGGCRKGHSRHACSRMLSRRCPFSVLIARKTLSRCS